jgi:hypothetical protein
MKRLSLLAAVAAVALAACTPAKKPEAAGGAKFDTSLSVKEVMGHNVDVGAQKFWCASGDVVTDKGTMSRAPTTEAGWEDAVSGATILVESGNLLQLPDRARDNGDWMKFAQQLTKIAMEGRVAAENHDVDTVFSTGGRIYEVCTACHEKYLLPFIDTKTGEPIAGSPLDSGVKEPEPAVPPPPDYKCPTFEDPPGTPPPKPFKKPA